MSQGQPGLSFLGSGNSTSVTVGYGDTASDSLLPCSSANATVSPSAFAGLDVMSCMYVWYSTYVRVFDDNDDLL